MILAFVLLAGMASQVFSAPDRFYLRDHGRKITKISEPRPNYVPGEILVKFNDGTPARRRGATIASAGLGSPEKTITSRDGDQIFLFKTNHGESVEHTIRTLRASNAVEYAEPNYIYELLYTPDDPDFSKQWGLNNTGQDIQGTPGTAGVDIGAVKAWDMEQGFSSTVTVAVLDSGIDLDHPDLAAKLWTNTGEIAGDGVDNDANGYIDDVNGFNTAGIGLGMYWVLEGFNPIRPFAGAKYEVAQSITGTDAYLNEVGFFMTREGTPTADMQLAVRDDLNGADLATATITSGDTSSIVMRVLTDLSAPVFIEKGKTYYIVVMIDDASATANDHFSIGEASYIEDVGAGDIYREGMQHWKIGGDWLSFPEYDFTFVTGNNGTPHDDNGHGTHVSGIVGAATNNAEGIAGVAPGVQIMPVKAGTAGGGLMLSDIIEAIYYAADNGADVINMSFGGGADSELLDQVALNYADLKGIVLVAAAGNTGGSALSYPAAYDNVLGVGATDNRDNRAGFSTFNSSVDFSAPGQAIYSTMPTYPVALNTSGFLQNYDFLDGTSMASPIVAGAAAVIKAARPSLTPVGIEKVLEKGAVDLGAPGRDDQFGYGRIDLYASLRTFLIDTTFLVDPRSANGDNGWYTSVPSISLFPSLTPADTFYSWDSTPAVTTYTVPFQPPSEGEHTLYFYSKTAGQTETVDSEVFKLDTELPTDSANVVSTSHSMGSPSSVNLAVIEFAAATDTASGVEGYSYSWSMNGMETPPQSINFPATGADPETISSNVSDGTQWFNLSTKDVAGNWTSTVHLGPFVIDTVKPTGSISMNSGAAYTKSKTVTLNLSATDPTPGSGIEKMRFKNGGGSWSGWKTYATGHSWTLPATNGTAKVHAEFKDKAGNISATVSDTIFLDDKKPGTKLVAPFVATRISKNRTFKVSWSATDPAPSSAVTIFDVQYREGSGSWKNWKINTAAKSALFDAGKVGKTYRFRARADDKAGNVGSWTPSAKTIIPYDNDKFIHRQDGFTATYNKPSSRLYYGTLRYSARKGHEIVYKFTGKRVILISTKARNRGKAKIYIDGKFVKTIDTFSSKTRMRQIVFHKKWGASKTHWLKIVNLGTPGRRVFDVDALAIEH